MKVKAERGAAIVTDAAPKSGALISVEDLAISFGRGASETRVVRSASFELARGEALGLVGESGSGKTVTSLALLGLLGDLGGRVCAGRILFDGHDLTGFRERDWLGVRGSRISMIFQQPTQSLNPAFTVGDQIAEGVRLHLGLSRRAAWDRAVEMLDRVGIADARRRASDYPHMFSGGMCQRVMIAIALAPQPELLIADEPTTALDVTVQDRILRLIDEIRRESGIAVLYISHDLGVVAETCDRVAVMYAGETVESASVFDVFANPRHPYTRGLLGSIPRRGAGRRLTGIPGTVPLPRDLPDGCSFQERCPYVDRDRCSHGEMHPLDVGPGHTSRCLRAHELPAIEHAQ